ncbi:NUDIX hydrolase [Burkholderia ubonensis]|uniref:NUDIX hydrolase n=1 Tax=Burkholderia ubonensis TaxID=101571 RepID=UPI0009B4B54E
MLCICSAAEPVSEIYLTDDQPEASLTDRIRKKTWIPKEVSRIRMAASRTCPRILAIVARSEPTILLTKRSSGLSEYSSHVSFPGGHPAESDHDVGATALREAFDEIHLEPGAVQLVGCLPLHKTRKRNHAIFPVVGIVSGTADWEAAPAEVDEIFEFPFATLLNPDLPRQYIDGARAGSWYWADQRHDIWGVTAVILKSLAGLALDSTHGKSLRHG